MVTAASLILSAALCSQATLSVQQAKALAIAAAPSLTSEAKVRHSSKMADVVTREQDGWIVRVYATNPCSPGAQVCSSLMGHYKVTSSGNVEDLDNETGRLMDTPELKRARAILRHDCAR